MHNLRFITLYFSSMLALEATAWPMMQLFERDDNSTDSGSDPSSGTVPKDATDAADSAWKALAFNFGYTALSANSSCAGTGYPLGYACIDDNVYDCVNGSWAIALDCVSQGRKCYALPGEELADDPIVDCKSYDEAYDLFTEPLGCNLGDPSGQAALFAYFYGMSDSGNGTSIQSVSAAPMTTPPTATATSTATFTDGAQTTDVQAEPEMTCTATDAAPESIAAVTSDIATTTPVQTSTAIDSSTATATSD